MITERERYLMKESYQSGFIDGATDAENGYSNESVEKRFERWLDDCVADNGGTVEQLLDSVASSIDKE